jgi:hypothetical protein
LGLVCAAALVAANVMLLGVGAIPAMLVWTIATSVVLGRSATTTQELATSGSAHRTALLTRGSRTREGAA